MTRMPEILQPLSGAPQGEDICVDQLLEDGARALLAAAPSLPSQADLIQELNDAKQAQARGYYMPDEDERLRQRYHRYLAVRVSLWQMIKSLLPIVDGQINASHVQNLRAQGIAFCAAAMLVRTGTYLLDMARGRNVVWEKLDEAAPRFGIERKTFTALYKGLTSPKIIAKYHKSWRFFTRYDMDIYHAMSGPLFGPAGQLLKDEVPHLTPELFGWARRRLSFRAFNYRRRHKSAARKTLFSLFEVSGSAIAELKQPFIKPVGAPKRVSAQTYQKVLSFCQPGDVFVTRHDDALSNVFLPGFWPHAALYIGDNEQRRALDMPLIEGAKHYHAARAVFLESKKDGVLFRPIEDTLKLDAFIILRPKLTLPQRRLAINNAMSHAGKLYDFSFDFSSADRLACTELIYRSYHKTGPIVLNLEEVAGRKCLSAEGLMGQLLRADWFDIAASFGLEGDGWQEGAPARRAVLASFDNELKASLQGEPPKP